MPIPVCIFQKHFFLATLDTTSLYRLSACYILFTRKVVISATHTSKHVILSTLIFIGLAGCCWIYVQSMFMKLGVIQ